MSASPPAADRLPRGRHKLSSEQVATTQRRRMFAAMCAATAEKGYAETTVADILSRAGVSRETFYEQFRSKQDCFAQAFDEAGATLFLEVLATVTSGPAETGPGKQGTRTEPTAERFDSFLTTYLATMASQPDLARLCLVEVYAAGPAMVRRRAAMQEKFTEGIARLFGATDADDRFACHAFVAAVSSMVTTRLALGEAGRLPELREPLVRLFRAAIERRDA